ncbi:hypothetical protein OPV22_012229 [Ensete ventricosum]|uniref:Uncharacterized protein n=1 Tax=Ensete ventricosum TaxID=4639 RepID=A0AAV8PHA9_ENSVE|nr:hypothetical protein OPV22_012229 [Ensete ventricosum]RWW53467.1 hypothetical protein BHE74_00040047 [Ensete ventricosum]RZS17055.1 hypothetical protein BHM03_00049162 [Ensete ventricosum]
MEYHHRHHHREEARRVACDPVLRLPERRPQRRPVPLEAVEKSAQHGSVDVLDLRATSTPSKRRHPLRLPLPWIEHRGGRRNRLWDLLKITPLKS